VRPPNDQRAVPRGAVPPAPPNASRDNQGQAYGRPAPIGPASGARPNDASRGGYAYPRGGYAVPRGNSGYPGYNYPHGAYRYPPAYGYRPHVVVPVVPYYRPYYTFHPHFSVGFGIFLGYPVPYPYAFGYPTYVYGAGAYGPSGQEPYYNVAPSEGSYGGMSLDITPTDADVYIDGAYVGRVADFSPMYQPLTMTPGRHHVELDAAGCEPLVFDVDIVAGQVLPYRGALRAY
jgi:hypothetical protein